MDRTFVAEIKSVSPYGFKSQYDKPLLQLLALMYGDYISVHSDPLWGGEVYDIRRVKELLGKNNTKKILAKGIHSTDQEIEYALRAGADYVLVVGRIPDVKFMDKVWLEPINLQQAREMIAAKPNAIVFNYRDLMTGEPRAWDVPPKVEGIRFIQASNIKTPHDIKVWCDGYIVGEHLPRFIVTKQMLDVVEKRNTQ